jgi:hypothetical protein
MATNTNFWGKDELTRKYRLATPGQNTDELVPMMPELARYYSEEIDITPEDHENILFDIQNLDWEDVVDLYDDSELVYEETPEDIQEVLSVHGRVNKRYASIRSRFKRKNSRSIALRRPSDPKKMRRRSIQAARRVAYKRILRGRPISTMSPSEKAKYEEKIKQMAPYVAIMSKKVHRKLRDIEKKRLAKRGQRKILKKKKR